MRYRAGAHLARLSCASWRVGEGDARPCSVIASAAKQRQPGLLRCARNDDVGRVSNYLSPSSWRKPGPIIPGRGLVGGTGPGVLSIDHAVWVLAFARTTPVDWPMARSQ